MPRSIKEQANVDPSRQQEGIVRSPQVGGNLLKIASCWDHFLVSENFRMLALDAKVTQLLNNIVGVDDLVEWSCRRSQKVVVADGVHWLNIFDLAVVFGV